MTRGLEWQGDQPAVPAAGVREALGWESGHLGSRNPSTGVARPQGGSRDAAPRPSEERGGLEPSSLISEPSWALSGGEAWDVASVSHSSLLHRWAVGTWEGWRPTHRRFWSSLWW